MKRVLLAALLAALAACAHARVMKEVSDCDGLTAEARIACSACTLQNKADGLLGYFEYRPDNKDGERCVRVR